MAKCPLCNSRKGKRKCLNTDGHVCSLCCGETRTEENCDKCSFYKQPEVRSKYSDIPSYTPKKMAASMKLQEYSNAIEGAFCAFDDEMERKITDDVPIRILELLFDKYHFKESMVLFDNDMVVEKGFLRTVQAIHEDLSTVPEETLVKVIGALYFVAKRRSEGGREYLRVINTYVGKRIETGVRVLRIEK